MPVILPRQSHWVTSYLQSQMWVLKANFLQTLKGDFRIDFAIFKKMMIYTYSVILYALWNGYNGNYKTQEVHYTVERSETL